MSERCLTHLPNEVVRNPGDVRPMLKRAQTAGFMYRSGPGKRYGRTLSARRVTGSPRNAVHSLGMTQAGTDARPSADHLYCRECGAPAAPSAKACAFCRSPVATLQCCHCFGFNVSSAVHCLNCGERLGLARVPSVDTTVKACPGCQAPLVLYRDDEGAMWDCQACEAQFVEHRLLDRLLAGRQRLPNIEAPRPHPLPLSAKITYYPCPHCAELMHRRNFGGRSGIVVDVCASHGVWFEASELDLVLRFVESGGLAVARRVTLGLPPPVGPDEQERVAKAIARSLGAGDRRGPASLESTPDDWVEWVERRLGEAVRLYLSWSRR